VPSETECTMQRMKIHRILLAVMGLVIASGSGKMSLGQPGTVSVSSTADATLEAHLREIAAAHHGKVALFAVQLGLGRSVGLDADTVVQTASVVKLTILFEAMEQVRSGKAHWDDKITLQPGDAVSGSGLLLLFDAPQTLTLKDVLSLMIIMSDNAATNLAIDKIGRHRCRQVRPVADLGLYV
jgi:beta-lactamase class A